MAGKWLLTTDSTPLSSAMHRPCDMLFKAVSKRSFWILASRPLSSALTRWALRNLVVDTTEMRVKARSKDRPARQPSNSSQKTMQRGVTSAVTWPTTIAGRAALRPATAPTQPITTTTP